MHTTPRVGRLIAAAGDVEPMACGDLLTVDVTHIGAGGTVIVAPTGEIDFLTAPILRSSLLGCLHPPYVAVILDLTGVSFLSAAGLAVLAEALQQAHAEGITLQLGGVRAGARRTLQITGLWDQLALLAR